jgi:hypothetical protein
MTRRFKNAESRLFFKYLKKWQRNGFSDGSATNAAASFLPYPHTTRTPLP